MNEVVPSAEIDAIKRDIAISAKTERAFKDYCRLFGYTHRNIRNKTILDVGAGYSSFTEAANGMGANVVKLDGIFMKEYGFLNKKNENAIRGYAQYLPFKDNVFDETVSAYCLYHIKIKPSKVISEMIRVTKPGGKIKIHPVHDIGFTDALNSEPSLFFFEVDEARTLVITKEQKCSHDYWQKLFDKLASSVAFREL